jgi:signal transduction histidine kinase
VPADPTRAQANQLDGFIVLGMRDRALNATLGTLRASELTAAGLVSAISVPLVIFAVRRWTRPLRLLMDATRRLAAGESPQPVVAAVKDDVGLLTEAFNEMAIKLSAAQAELRAANADLENKVVARTSELELAKRELESEIRDKNEFLRAVSHDLGAPLRNIGGMATMLLVKYKGVLADDALNKLERINVNVKAQTDLINDLLELSRIKTRPGKRSEIDLHAMVQELVESFAFDLDKNQIELKVDGRLPVIVADRNRVRQVFQNLLDNAIKYMLDAPTRKISVSFLNEGPHYHFRVADTGRGIAADDLPNLFQIYRRALHSGSHQVQGRGVGLASVKTIVETYGGRIWVESELGKGSTFHFTLEKAKVTGQAVDPPNAMESGVWAAVGSSGPRR